MVAKGVSIIHLELTDWMMSNIVIRQRGRAYVGSWKPWQTKCLSVHAYAQVYWISLKCIYKIKCIESRGNITNCNYFLLFRFATRREAMLSDHYHRVLTLGIRVKWVLNENFLYINIKINEEQQMIFKYSNETSASMISSNPDLTNRFLFGYPEY